jgi:hypothetical protein
MASKVDEWSSVTDIRWVCTDRSAPKYSEKTLSHFKRCPLHIQHALAWNRTRPSAVGRTATKYHLILLLDYCFMITFFGIDVKRLRACVCYWVKFLSQGRHHKQVMPPNSLCQCPPPITDLQTVWVILTQSLCPRPPLSLLPPFSNSGRFQTFTAM